MPGSNDVLLGSPSADDAATEAWLAAIFAPAPPAILAVAGDGAIVAANVQAERLFDANRDELTGRTFDSLFLSASEEHAISGGTMSRLAPGAS